MLSILLTLLLGFGSQKVEALPAPQERSSCPTYIVFGTDLSEIQAEVGKALQFSATKGKVPLLTKPQEEFLFNIAVPLLGLNLIRTTGEVANLPSQYRRLRVNRSAIVFEGFGYMVPNLVIEWSPLVDKPTVGAQPFPRVLMLPDRTKADKAWVNSWAIPVFKEWLSGHPLGERLRSLVDAQGEKNLCALLPLAESAFSKKVTEVPNPDLTLPGALSFADLTPPVRVVHPEKGVIQVIEKKDVGGDGQLLIKAYQDETITKLTQQETIVFAELGSPAANWLSQERADRFASIETVGLLFLEDYLLHLRSNAPVFFERLSKLFSEVSNTDLSSWVDRLKNQMLYQGIRKDEDADYATAIEKAFRFSKKVEENLGLDLVRTALLGWGKNEHQSFSWPNLATQLQSDYFQSTALAKQTNYQKADILIVFVKRLYKLGSRVWEKEKDNSPHNSKFLVPGLTAYYTRSHPLNTVDWFSRELTLLKDEIGRDEASIQSQAFKMRQALRLVLAFKTPLVQTGLFSGEPFDVLTNVIGSRVRRNRAFYLTQALVKVLDLKEDSFQELFTINDRWNGRSQTSQRRLFWRIRNATKKFKIKLGKHRFIKGKRILLIEDTTTSGVTIDECRRILFEAGAQSVHVLAFAQTFSNEEVSPFSLKLNEEDVYSSHPLLEEAALIIEREIVQIGTKALQKKNWKVVLAMIDNPHFREQAAKKGSNSRRLWYQFLKVENREVFLAAYRLSELYFTNLERVRLLEDLLLNRWIDRTMCLEAIYQLLVEFSKYDISKRLRPRIKAILEENQKSSPGTLSPVLLFLVNKATFDAKKGSTLVLSFLLSNKEAFIESQVTQLCASLGQKLKAEKTSERTLIADILSGLTVIGTDELVTAFNQAFQTVLSPEEEYLKWYTLVQTKKGQQLEQAATKLVRTGLHSEKTFKLLKSVIETDKRSSISVLGSFVELSSHADITEAMRSEIEVIVRGQISDYYGKPENMLGVVRELLLHGYRSPWIFERLATLAKETFPPRLSFRERFAPNFHYVLETWNLLVEHYPNADDYSVRLLEDFIRESIDTSFVKSVLEADFNVQPALRTRYEAYVDKAKNAIKGK